MADREQVVETATKGLENRLRERRELVKMGLNVSASSVGLRDDEGGTMTGIWQRVSALSLLGREGDFGDRQEKAPWCRGHCRNELKHSFMYRSRSYSV